MSWAIATTLVWALIAVASFVHLVRSRITGGPSGVVRQQASLLGQPRWRGEPLGRHPVVRSPTGPPPPGPASEGGRGEHLPISINRFSNSGRTQRGVSTLTMRDNWRAWVTVRNRSRSIETGYRRDLGLVAASMASAIRGGQMPASAMVSVVRSADARLDPGLVADIIGADERVRRGTPFARALLEWSDAVPCPEVDLFVAAVLLGLTTGGRLADALDGVAQTLAIRTELVTERRALTSQAVITTRMLVVVPVAFSALASIVDPRVARVLFATGFGWIVVLCAVILDAAAVMWMRTIVRGAQ